MSNLFLVGKILHILDREDEEQIVDDNFDQFKLLYEPILEEKFRDVMEIREGNFYIDHNDLATRRLLSMHINDNVYKNLKTFSPLLFDETQRYSKE